MLWNARGALDKQAFYSCGKSLDLQVNIGIAIHYDIIKIMPLSPLLSFLKFGFSFESGKKSKNVTDWKSTSNKQISLRKFPKPFLIRDYFLAYTPFPLYYDPTIYLNISGTANNLCLLNAQHSIKVFKIKTKWFNQNIKPKNISF